MTTCLQKVPRFLGAVMITNSTEPGAIFSEAPSASIRSAVLEATWT